MSFATGAFPVIYSYEGVDVWITASQVQNEEHDDTCLDVGNYEIVYYNLRTHKFSPNEITPLWFSTVEHALGYLEYDKVRQPLEELQIMKACTVGYVIICYHETRNEFLLQPNCTSFKNIMN